jgi:hypothetical protein
VGAVQWEAGNGGPGLLQAPKQAIQLRFAAMLERRHAYGTAPDGARLARGDLDRRKAQPLAPGNREAGG